MLVRAGQSKAGQDPQRLHRGNCEKRILHAWYTTYLSGMLVGYRLRYCVPLLEQNDCHFAQSKGFRAVPKNRTLTDALEQQEAGRCHPRKDKEPPCCGRIAWSD